MATHMRRVLGSLVLALAATGVVVACSGGADDDPILGPPGGSGTGTSSSSSGTVGNNDGGGTNIHPPPGPAGAGAAYCDATFGKFIATYGKCCTADDQLTSEYKLTVGLITAAVATCGPELDGGLTSGRLSYDASSAQTCYPAYATFIDSFACGFPAGTGTNGTYPQELASCGTVFTGLVGAGGGCRGDHECLSGLTCVGWTSNTDGICKQPPAIGEACGEGQTDGGSLNINIRFGFGTHPKCAAGAWCSLRKCKALAQPGGQCFQNDECPSGLKCLQQICSSGELSDVNGACKSSGDCKTGLYCAQTSYSTPGTCQTKKSANEACGTFVTCKGRCERADGSTNGTCKAYCGSG